MRSSHGFSVLLAAWFMAGTAGAFCRTTTCDAINPNADCNYDPRTGCAAKGADLFWPDSCTWFGVQKDGSPKLKISYQTFYGIVRKSFGKWETADCGGGAHPSFAAEDTDALYGPALCDGQEYNQHAANANVWMFRDKDWPYSGGSSTIALTTLTIDTISGQILDADVEINSFGNPNITTSNTNVGSDLESIVTHESGHFLGLAHSRVQGSTMFWQYTPSSLDIRTLSSDDVEGICAIYPPDSGAPSCPEPAPLTGFSLECGGVNPITQPVPRKQTTASCDFAARNAGGSAWRWALVALLAMRRKRPTGEHPTRSAAPSR